MVQSLLCVPCHMRVIFGEFDNWFSLKLHTSPLFDIPIDVVMLSLQV